MCVVCPWHKHMITLDTGESLYTSIDPSNPKIQKPNCSKGVKQRIHHAKIEGDTVYVKISDLEKELDSDRYYSDEYKEFMKNALDEPILVNRDAVKVPIHSSRKHLRQVKWIVIFNMEQNFIHIVLSSIVCHPTLLLLQLIGIIVHQTAHCRCELFIVWGSRS